MTRYDFELLRTTFNEFGGFTLIDDVAGETGGTPISLYVE